MRNSIVTVVAIMFLALLFVPSVSNVSANKQILTSSTIVSYTTTSDCVPVNDRIMQCTFVSDQQWDGDWIGRTVFKGRWTINDGKLATASGRGTFDGTVLGKSGTVYLGGVTNAWFTVCKEHDSMPILGATGELAGMHGHFGKPGWFCNPTGVETYMIIHF